MVDKAKIQSSVDKAFSKLDSLAYDAVFTSKTTSSFDFATGEAVTSQATTYTTRGFIETVKTSVEGFRSNTAKLIVKSGGFRFDGYSYVTVNGIQYSFKVMNDNGFVAELEIARIE